MFNMSALAKARFTMFVLLHMMLLLLVEAGRLLHCGSHRETVIGLNLGRSFEKKKKSELEVINILISTSLINTEPGKKRKAAGLLVLQNSSTSRFMI